MNSLQVNRYKLFKIACLDMLCLIDMERNGIVFNTEKAMEHAKGIAERQSALYSRLVSLVGCDVININSGDHLLLCFTVGLSLTLLGSLWDITSRELKLDRCDINWKMSDMTCPVLSNHFPRHTAKSQKRLDEGLETEHTLWGVNEPVLRILKAKGIAKEVLTIILEYSKLDKLRGHTLKDIQI